MDGLQQDIATLAAAMREGFQQIREEMRLGFSEMRGRFDAVDRRFETVDRRFDDLTDIVQRIYTEHGQRLKDLEDHFTNHSAA